MDVFIQPHSDDICFSLGAFAYRRNSGILLTVCPAAAYVAPRHVKNLSSMPDVSSKRIAEDQEFAKACGLECRFLELASASCVGFESFDRSRVDENSRRIGPKLLEALHSAAMAGSQQVRPWLFCPAGIGNHIDHVGIRMAVVENYVPLSQHFRIAFYEDLHYASNKNNRESGVQQLLETLSPRRIHRYEFPLGKFLRTKLSLIRTYDSQLTSKRPSIRFFSPGTVPPTAPHEAFWAEEPFLDPLPARTEESIGFLKIFLHYLTMFRREHGISL